MEQKLHEERAAAAARAAYFENMAARERIKARVNQQLGRPAGGQHYYGGAEAEPMLQQEFSESWKRGEMLEQNQAAKHAAREAEQNAYEKALAEARAQAYRERLELQQKRLQAQQDASQEVPEEGSPGGIAEQMSPRRDLLKSRSADDARPTTADKAAEHAEALAKARREAFEERKRLEELRRRAQEAAEEGSSPATVGTPRSTQSEPAKDAVMNKPPRARRESKKRAGGIRERLEARAKQGKLPPKSALPPREDRRVRRPSGKQQGSAAARPRSVSDQVPEEAEAGVEGLRMPRQRSESENDLHAGRPRKASASEEAAPQGPGINTRLAEALGQVNAVMSEVNDLQFRRKNPSPSPAPEDGGFEDDEEEEDPDAAFREAPEDVPAKGGEQLGDEARQLSDLTSTLLAGVRNDLEDWWNEEEGEEGDLENEMEEEKDAVLHEVDIEFMKDNIMKVRKAIGRGTVTLSLTVHLPCLTRYSCWSHRLGRMTMMMMMMKDRKRVACMELMTMRRMSPLKRKEKRVKRKAAAKEMMERGVQPLREGKMAAAVMQPPVEVAEVAVAVKRVHRLVETTTRRNGNPNKSRWQKMMWKKPQMNSRSCGVIWK